MNVTKHYDGILWCLVGVILIGVMYVPPARSVNLDDELFEHLQNDIIYINNEYNVESVCLMGNGRTGAGCTNRS